MKLAESADVQPRAMELRSLYCMIQYIPKPNQNSRKDESLKMPPTNRLTVPYDNTDNDG